MSIPKYAAYVDARDQWVQAYENPNDIWEGVTCFQKDNAERILFGDESNDWNEIHFHYTKSE